MNKKYILFICRVTLDESIVIYTIKILVVEELNSCMNMSMMFIASIFYHIITVVIIISKKELRMIHYK